MKKKNHRALHRSNKDSKPNLYVIWRTALTVMATILGVFIGPFIEQVFPPLFDPKNLPYIAFGVIVALFLVGSTLKLSLAANTYKRISVLERECASIIRTLGPRIRIVPYDEAVAEYQKRAAEAQFEILVLSNYKRFDWDKKQPVNFDDSFATQSPRRQENYKSTQAKLLKEKGNQFRFVKIVQIPDGHKLEEVFPGDPFYQDDCKFIVELSNEDPKFANLRVSEIFFQNTFCIIDRSFLYLEFDIRSFMKKNVKPFVMLVDDRNSKFTKEFVAVFEGINAVAKRIDSI